MLNQNVEKGPVLGSPKRTPLEKLNSSISRLRETLDAAKFLRQEITNEQEPESLKEAVSSYQCIAAALNNGPDEIVELAEAIDRELQDIRSQLL